MRTAPIPLFPLLACLLGFGMFAGGIWHTLRAPVENVTFEQPSWTSSEKTAEIVLLKYHDTPLAIEASELIVTSSGFATDRTAYSRSVQTAAARPAAPEYKPQYVGRLGKGDELRVMIVWKPGDRAQTHSVGDDTPWGKLHKITSTELWFESQNQQKSLSIY